MWAWVFLFCLLHSHLIHLGADGKRFDPSMVDPLTRRSPLDKNFMRFGRSSPAYTEEDGGEDNHDSSDTEASKEEDFLRSMRGKDNFMRFGRAKNDNFMRFGRGKQDNFMRFGKSPDNFMRFGRGKQDNYMRFGRGKQDNYMRFGRGKQDSYMRFGRGKQDNYMRFGRGKQDNYMRFGRGKQDNYMRFGRGKQDSYMRFGRGKQDNYMRFGRNFEDTVDSLSDMDQTNVVDSDITRSSRGKQDNFMRFGKSYPGEPDTNIPIAMRSESPKGNSNFIRFGRTKQDNFMRFGKSDDDKIPLQFNEDQEEKPKGSTNYPISTSEHFIRETKAKDLNLIRFGRQPPNKNDGFIRFGRNIQDQSDENPDTELIPQRLKRSVLDSYGSQPEVYPSKLQDEIGEHDLIPYSSIPDDLEEEYSSPVHQEDYSSRWKRSLKFEPSTSSPPFSDNETSAGYISAKLRFDTLPEPNYQSSLFSAGLPNVIVGPEFSLLPDLDPPITMLKKGRPGDQNFLRLG